MGLYQKLKESFDSVKIKDYERTIRKINSKYYEYKTYDYYVGLAGGFNKSMNSGKAVEIIDAEGNKLSKKSEITPETTITAETNSFLFYFNQYAPVVTTILSIISTSLSIMAVTGVFGK